MNDTLKAHTDLLTYVLQDDVHNRLTPRVIDIAYTAFMQGKSPNLEDGGPSDWFNDTRPVVQKAIDKLRTALVEDRDELLDVDKLSNFIRQVDGNNKMGAGELAEKIVEFIKKEF